MCLELEGASGSAYFLFIPSGGPVLHMVCGCLLTGHFSLPSSRQHQICDDCLEVGRENNRNCSVLCTIVEHTIVEHNDTHTHVNSC